MPIGNWNLQWLNHNSQRSYPLTERATKLDTTSTIRIPDSFILALYFPVHAGLDVSVDRFYISNILISTIGYTIGIGYNDPTDVAVLVGNVNIPAATHTANTTYSVGGINDFADSVGYVVIGRLDEINALPQGFYEFDIAGAEIEPDAIRPMIRGVSGMRAVSLNETSETLYGDIEFVAGTNMQILVDQVTNKITFNAISGENLNTSCDCAVSSVGECIRCINGVCSGDGNFNLVGIDCINIEAGNSRIRISDVCASPCCGCAELDALKTQIDRFSDGVSTLENFVTRLGSEVTQMSLVVIGSRLGDSGCSDC
jgi:hypothetical protein